MLCFPCCASAVQAAPNHRTRCTGALRVDSDEDPYPRKIGVPPPFSLERPKQPIVLTRQFAMAQEERQQVFLPARPPRPQLLYGGGTLRTRAYRSCSSYRSYSSYRTKGRRPSHLCIHRNRAYSFYRAVELEWLDPAACCMQRSTAFDSFRFFLFIQRIQSLSPNG